MELVIFKYTLESRTFFCTRRQLHPVNAVKEKEQCQYLKEDIHQPDEINAGLTMLLKLNQQATALNAVNQDFRTEYVNIVDSMMADRL